MADPLLLPESDEIHTVGDPGCDACWSSPAVPHECGVAGCLEHNSWGDENYDGDYWLYRLGDLCRER